MPVGLKSAGLVRRIGFDGIEIGDFSLLAEAVRPCRLAPWSDGLGSTGSTDEIKPIFMQVFLRHMHQSIFFRSLL